MTDVLENSKDCYEWQRLARTFDPAQLPTTCGSLTFSVEKRQFDNKTQEIQRCRIKIVGNNFDP